MLSPTGQHPWAPVGETPILDEHRRHRRPLSGIGALSISPNRKHLGWYMHLHEGSIGEAGVVAFLRDLQRHLRGGIVLAWDNLGAHHSAMGEDYLACHPRLIPEFLPPYAPELNAIEYAWSYLKTNPLANLCPHDTDDLTDHVREACGEARTEQSRLRGFVEATGLPIQGGSRVNIRALNDRFASTRSR
jgi:transposase